MEKEDEINFDTDLDDDEPGNRTDVFFLFHKNHFKDQTNECTLPRLSFDKKLIAHRSNRLNQTFGQINVPFQIESKKEIEADTNTLVPLRCKTPHNNGKSNQLFA
jgi:hypothetical protein